MAAGGSSRMTGILSLTPTELRALRRSPQQPGGAAMHLTRQHNLSVVRRLLYGHGPLTRPELAKLSGLSLPTIGGLVTQLIEEGTVTARGIVTESRVGKPASRVGIDTEGNVSLVLDLTHDDRFRGAIITLDGTIVDRAEVEIGQAFGDAAVEYAVELAELLIERARVQIVGIGVASPGLVDDTGQVHVADRLQWRDVPLADTIRRRTGIPTFVGNDVNLLALGLSRFRNRSGRDAIVVALDNGVGAAVLEQGEPVLGEQFAAGEIAHLTVQPDGEPCRCGRRGCLDMVVGAPHLGRRLERDGEGVLEPAGRALGQALAPIVLVLNTNVVVVVGPERLVVGPFTDGVIDGLHSRLRPAIIEGLTIEVGPNDPDLVLLGAAGLVMDAQLGVFSA